MRHEIVVPKKQLLLYYSEQSEQNGANGQEEYRSRRAQINKQDDFAEKNYKVLLHESKEDITYAYLCPRGCLFVGKRSMLSSMMTALST